MDISDASLQSMSASRLQEVLTEMGLSAHRSHPSDEAKKKAIRYLRDLPSAASGSHQVEEPRTSRSLWSPAIIAINAVVIIIALSLSVLIAYLLKMWAFRRMGSLGIEAVHEICHKVDHFILPLSLGLLVLWYSWGNVVQRASSSSSAVTGTGGDIHAVRQGRRQAEAADRGQQTVQTPAPISHLQKPSEPQGIPPIMATLATDVESTSPPTDNWAVQVPNSTPREEQLLAQLGHAAQKYEALVFKSEAAKAHLTHQKEEVRLRLERIEARFKRAQDQFQELSGENKRYRRELFDLRKSVWTYARIRPRIEQDRSNELIDLVPSDPSKYRRSLVLRKQHKIDRLDADTEFEFDRVFHQSDTNRDVSANVKPMVQAAADDGLNVAIFLEGPSGSGKSHTLFEQDDSIAFSMATYLFERPGFEDEPPRPEIRLYGFKVYQDRLYEALDGACATTLHIASTEARLGVYRDQRFRDRVEGQEVSSAPQLTAAMKRIYDARDKCCTEQNETSSRGHTICMLEFHRCRTAAGELSVSLLFLVDLAGPEPIKQSQNRTETKSITKSRTELQNQLREMVKQHRPNAKFDQNAHDAMKRNLKDSPVARRMNSYSPS